MDNQYNNLLITYKQSGESEQFNRTSLDYIWFNEDESKSILFLNNKWVIASSPFNESDVLFTFSSGNWPDIKVINL